MKTVFRSEEVSESSLGKGNPAVIYSEELGNIYHHHHQEWYVDAYVEFRGQLSFILRTELTYSVFLPDEPTLQPLELSIVI